MLELNGDQNVADPKLGTSLKVRLLLSVCLLGAVIAGPAWATTVYVTSVGFSNVQVIINGTTVRSIQIGETTPEGVRLAGIENGAALLEVDKRLIRMSIGQSTISQAILQLGPGGQFRATGYINGIPVRAVIDTGASDVALASGTAVRLGIDYQRGRRSVRHTANGTVPVYEVIISSVQVGDIVLSNVPGSVTEGATISQNIDVLIGNSFLTHVHMQRSGDTMTLTRSNSF